MKTQAFITGDSVLKKMSKRNLDPWILYGVDHTQLPASRSTWYLTKHHPMYTHFYPKLYAEELMFTLKKKLKAQNYGTD